MVITFQRFCSIPTSNTNHHRPSHCIKVLRKSSISVRMRENTDQNFKHLHEKKDTSIKNFSS